MKDLVGSTRKGLIDGGFRIASETDLSRGDVLGREMIYTNGTILSVTRWYFTGQSIYVVTAVVLGALFTLGCLDLRRHPTPKRAMRLFSFSITYVTVLFAAIAVDTLVRNGL